MARKGEKISKDIRYIITKGAVTDTLNKTGINKIKPNNRITKTILP
jgi:hypothetical protein